MKRLRVLALLREGLVPPETMEGYTEKEVEEWKTEFDVITTLKELGHEVMPIGVYDDLTPIREAILQWKPDIAFMLLEEFHGVVTYDQAIVSYLELMQQPYTGCNPRGLLLSKDKALSKKIMSYHRILSPKFAVFPRSRKVNRPRRLNFPLFVKSATEDASLGIAQASIVHDDAALIERVRFTHEHTESDALVEEYIEGREMYVGIMGNDRLQSFPPWELLFEKTTDHVANIATRRVKWNRKYQTRHGITTGKAELPTGAENQLGRICKRVYRRLHMSGYARMDLRMNTEGNFYVIEANANPNISFGEDFAESAEKTGIQYKALLQRIINYGLRYPAPWRS